MAKRAHGYDQQQQHEGQHDPSSLLRPLVGAQSHRYKRVGITCALLQQMCTQGSRSEDIGWGARCVEGLPPDARLVYSYIGWSGTEQVLGMIFEHEDWPEVPEGQEVPEFTPVFQTYRKDGLPER